MKKMLVCLLMGMFATNVNANSSESDIDNKAKYKEALIKAFEADKSKMETDMEFFTFWYSETENEKVVKNITTHYKGVIKEMDKLIEEEKSKTANQLRDEAFTKWTYNPTKSLQKLNNELIKLKNEQAEQAETFIKEIKIDFIKRGYGEKADNAGLMKKFREAKLKQIQKAIERTEAHIMLQQTLQNLL